MLFNQDSWRELGRRQPQTFNVVVYLAKQTTAADATEAYFKYSAHPPGPNQGPMAANERICYELSQLLGWPNIPKVELLEFNGQKGHIIRPVPGDCVEWNLADAYPPFINMFGANITGRIPECFASIEDFCSMLLFDVWVANGDRHGGNFMVSLQPGASRLGLYAIDHGHCLFGTESVQQQYLQREAAKQHLVVGHYIRQQEITAVVTVREMLQPYVEQISALSDQTLDELVDSFVSSAADYLTPDQANFIKRLLKSRRDALPDMIQSWCDQRQLTA